MITKRKPTTPEENAAVAAEQQALTFASVPGPCVDADLQKLAEAAHAAGKDVIQYPKMIRVDY